MESYSDLFYLLLEILLGLYAGALALAGTLGAFGMPLASFVFRLLASYGTLCACALYGVAASVVLRIVGLHRISQWATARAFKYSMRYTCGVRFRVVAGAEHLRARPVVFVGNHQTALDVLMLGTTFPKYCSVTAKQSLRHMPFLGWFMALSGTVFIDRGNRQTAMKAFEGAAHEIREQRQSVFIFPEGTRSNPEQPMLLPFKKGAFHLAIQAKVPVVPMVVACYAGVLSLSQWRFRRGEIPIVVLPPIATEHLGPSDVEQLCNQTRDRMLRTLQLLSESPAGAQALLAEPPALSPEDRKALDKDLEERFGRDLSGTLPSARETVTGS